MIKIININTEKLLLTKLGQKMLKKPMGFFDVGSLGGIHPITENFSNYLNVVCFEPNKKELNNIEKKYATKVAAIFDYYFSLENEDVINLIKAKYKLTQFS